MPLILLLGGSGRLGGALRAARPGEIVAPPREAVDLTRPETLGWALGRYRPSLVINAAAWTDVDGADRARSAAFAVNAVGVGRLGALCAARGIGLVHLSTDHVFDGRGGGPYAPGDPLAPANAYGASKAAGERRLLGCGGRVAIVRTAWLHGGGQRDFLSTVRARGASGPVPVVADQRGHPTPVEGLARWLLGLCEDAPAGPWRIWHAAGTPAIDRVGWVRAAAPEVDVRPVTSDRFVGGAARPRDARLDTLAADAAYGPIRWEVGR